MHVSLSILAEKLTAGCVRVIQSEEGRSIASITSDPRQAEGSTLLVCEPGCLEELPDAVRHLLLVNANEAAVDACASVPNLATMEVDGGATTAYSLVSCAMLSLARWDSRMLEAIATRQGVNAVLVIAAEELVNPVALFDSKQTLLAYAGSLTESSDDTIWREILENQHLNEEYFTEEERFRYAPLARRDWPFVLEPSRDPLHKHLTTILRADGQEVGSIGQVDIAAPFTQGQIALTDLVADRLRIALAMRLGNGPGEDDTTHLLRSILNGNKTDEGLASYHLKRMGWDASSGFSLALCPMPEAGRTPITDKNRIARLRAAWPRAIVMLYEDSVIALVDGENAEAPKQFIGILEAFGMVLITSEPFFRLEDVRLAYEQCRLVEMTHPGDGRMQTRLSDCADKAIPIALETGVSPRSVADSRIVELAGEGYKGDVERGRSLVEELLSYLMNGCNYNQTARELYLHRNTLIYRIELLEKMLGVSFPESSRSARFYFIVSCLVALSA